MIKEIRILGLMSGTSLDGVDAAILHFRDGQVTKRGASSFEPYTEREREILRANLGEWKVSQAALDAIHNAHRRAISALEGEFDCVGFHGQTLAHDPTRARTFQAGDPSQLEVDCPVYYDFRSRDMCEGGEGAPLLPVYHYALAKELNFKSSVIFLNIGGVSNLTLVRGDLPPEEGLISLDCGPGNAIIDDLVWTSTDERFDRDGALARTGVVNEELVLEAMKHPFFALEAPKSLDRNSFDDFAAKLVKLDLNDAVATASAFTIACIQKAINDIGLNDVPVIACGGGRKNLFLLEGIGAKDIDEFGLDGDMIEAEGFAYLANCYMLHLPISFPMTTGVKKPMRGGKKWEPNRSNI